MNISLKPEHEHILYQVLEDGIVIVRVVSGDRNKKSLFSDSDD